MNYRFFIDTLFPEDYFNILDDKDVLTLAKFRMIIFKLPIESGMWQSIERDQGKCSLSAALKLISGAVLSLKTTDKTDILF